MAVNDLDLIALEAYQARANGQNVPSPCVQVCRLDEHTGWCEGCFRRLEEIGAWSSMDHDAKWVVWQRIARRRGVSGAAPAAPLGGNA